MQEKQTSASSSSPMLKTILITSLSLNVFTLSALAMYGTWLGAAGLTLFERGIASLFMFVASFGAGTLLFWKMIVMLSGVGER